MAGVPVDAGELAVDNLRELLGLADLVVPGEELLADEIGLVGGQQGEELAEPVVVDVLEVADVVGLLEEDEQIGGVLPGFEPALTGALGLPIGGRVGRWDGLAVPFILEAVEGGEDGLVAVVVFIGEEFVQLALDAGVCEIGDETGLERAEKPRLTTG